MDDTSTVTTVAVTKIKDPNMFSSSVVDELHQSDMSGLSLCSPHHSTALNVHLQSCSATS